MNHQVGETFNLQLAPDPRHIMRVLTDMYADAAMAVQREYPANALDAHTAAGIAEPVEIFLPSLGIRTTTHPLYRVVDHGAGLSTDQIVERFAVFGLSTKQGDEDSVGELGMGCKSALTYGLEEFTVRSTHEGTMSVVRIYREDGLAKGEILSVGPSVYDSGTEIRIPVPEHLVDRFNEAARRLYRFWDVGSILVDDEEPEFIFDEPDARKLDDEIILTTSVEFDRVVMGNVAYPVSTQHALLARSWDTQNAPRVIARVPLGSVDFTPSRESLNYTEKTLKTLDTIRTWVKGKALHAAQAEIEATTNKLDALEVAEAWRAMGFKAPYTYRAEIVPTEITFGKAYGYSNLYPIGWSGKGTSDKATWKGTNRSMHMSTAARFVHIVGFDTDRVGSNVKQKIMHYLNTNRYFSEHKFDSVLLYGAQPLADWLPAERVVDFETIQAIKLPKEPRERMPRSKTPLFRTLNRNGEVMDYETWGGDRVRVVMEATMRDASTRSALGRLAAREDVHAAVFLLTPAKYQKWQAGQSVKGVPTGAISVAVWLERLAVATVAQATPMDVWKRHVGRSTQALERLDVDQLIDPAFAAFVRRIKQPSTFDWNLYLGAERLRHTFNTDVQTDLPTYESIKTESVTIDERYPLLNHLSDPDAATEYINALYLYRAVKAAQA